MDAALENSPGPPKWMGATPRPGYPVDTRFLDQTNGYVFPPHPANNRDPEQPTLDGAKEKESATVCCGCSTKAAVITAIVLVVLLLLGAGLGVGLGIGLNKPNPPPRQVTADAPSPAASAPAPALAAGSAAQPDCNTDQECFVNDQGWWCVAGTCVYQLPDAYYCNKTSDSRRCYSGVCGDTGALGVAKPTSAFACLITTGNRCKRAEACASGVCKELGSDTAPAQYCVSRSGVADEPLATFVDGSPCKVDVDCGGQARCLQSKCTEKADYGESCAGPDDCFSGDCIFDATNGNICSIADGALCGTVEVCKGDSLCSSDGYCVTGSAAPAPA